MKTITLQKDKAEAFNKTNKLLLTAGMLACVTAGWCLGSLTTKASLQNKNTIMLQSVPVKGESLPTIMLKEFSVIGNK